MAVKRPKRNAIGHQYEQQGQTYEPRVGTPAKIKPIFEVPYIIFGFGKIGPQNATKSVAWLADSIHFPNLLFKSGLAQV